MTTLLPSSARPVRTFADWVEYVRFRLGQASKLDAWRGLPPVAFGIGSRREQLLLRLSFACAATSVVAAFLLPWRFAMVLAVAAALLGTWTLLAMRSARRRELARRGQSDVAIGALVMANEGMFDPENPADLPGVLVVTRDAKLMLEPDVLIALSFRLFGLRNREPSHVPDELRAISERLTRGGWFEPLPIPAAWTGNDDTALFPCWFVRHDLPYPALERRIFPVLAHPDLLAHEIELLPKEMWWRDDIDAALSKEFGSAEEDGATASGPAEARA